MIVCYGEKLTVDIIDMPDFMVINTSSNVKISILGSSWEQVTCLSPGAFTFLMITKGR